MPDILEQLDAGLLRERIDAVVSRTMQMDMTWDWPCGVAFYGISHAWEATGDQRYIDYLSRWVDEYITIGLPPFMVNAVAMGHCLLTLHQATGDKKYLDIALEKAEYLRTKATRFGQNVFQHTVSPKNDFPGQAWADTLFMAAYFLLRMGKFLNEAAYTDDALNQYYWHEELLQSQQNDLFYHGYDDSTRSHMSGMFWARGNAWAAYTMARALKLIDYTYPMFMQIDGALRDQLAALVRLQDQGGLWHTLLDDPDSYPETSASAGFGAALLSYGNPLHRKAVLGACNGLLGKISADGSVLDVSAGTAVMRTREDYKKVPHKRIQGWGQGFALVFLSELYAYVAGEPGV